MQHEPRSDARELAMWLAVIEQAVADATSDSVAAGERFARLRARHWLTRNSDGFRDVCQAAAVDADDVREKALRLEAKGWPSPDRRQKKLRRNEMREMAQESR